MKYEGKNHAKNLLQLCQTFCWHGFIRNPVNLKNYFMRTILYVIALILVIGWVLGLTVYSAGSIIHILLVLAIVSVLLGLIRRGGV